MCLSRAVTFAFLLALPALVPTARAGWGIGVSIGAPYRHFHGWYGYRPYYRPYYPYPAVVVAPPPVVLAPVAPACPAPVVAGSAPVDPPPVMPDAPPPPPQPVAVVSSDNDGYLRQLSNADERVRISAAMRLGRERVRSAVPALSGMLSRDPNPQVREAAARSLGLIAAPESLSALQNAAQGDDDREVRTSARFAAEVIRGELRR